MWFRPILAASGLGILAVLWLGPLPHRASGSFLAHMTMHVGVLAVASPLLALSWPGAVARLPFLAYPMMPLLASMFEFAVVWVWHTPAAHAFASGSALGLIIEQASFLVCGLLLWTSALNVPANHPGHAAIGVLALFLTSMHMTLLGALISLSPRALYRHGHSHDTALQVAIDDQHLGGAIMLGAAGTIYLIAALAGLRPLLRPAQP